MTARDLPIDLLVDPALVLPASKRRALPPVTVVLDRGDDARFTAAALAASRPRAGCITIHPTVGTARTDVLLHDHLTALGRSVVNLRTQGLAQEAAAERAVRAWMWAEGIRHVIVLRSHLPRLRLHYLLDLHAATGAALTVVWHAPALGRDLERLLNSVNHRVVDTLHAAREAFHTPFVRACRCPGRPPRARILIPGWDTPVAALPPAVVLERIRRHIPHPLYAAALTAAWTTGASPHLLRGARLQDLTPAATHWRCRWQPRPARDPSAATGRGRPSVSRPGCAPTCWPQRTTATWRTPGPARGCSPGFARTA
ncbi:hypothetical protein GCM10025734_83940 [Kitasatospora paranensis]|uniref:hypothetical protein n=1 Tax=Kitasatospora paranensis TaxID=258053 RepID=UPI0031EA34BE